MAVPTISELRMWAIDNGLDISDQWLDSIRIDIKNCLENGKVVIWCPSGMAPKVMMDLIQNYIGIKHAEQSNLTEMTKDELLLEQAEKDLEEALSTESYEMASILRDEIKRIKLRIDGQAQNHQEDDRPESE